SDLLRRLRPALKSAIKSVLFNCPGNPRRGPETNPVQAPSSFPHRVRALPVDVRTSGVAGETTETFVAVSRRADPRRPQAGLAGLSKFNRPSRPLRLLPKSICRNRR